MNTQTATPNTPHIPIAALGWSLGVFLAIAFTLDLVFPSAGINRAWLPLLPWVSEISTASFLPGLLETVLYGGFATVIFAPLFNFYAKKAAIAGNRPRAPRITRHLTNPKPNDVYRRQ